MAEIYIVNHMVSGMYAQVSAYYHRTEVEAQESFHDCVQSASDDPNVISLVRLDTETLDATTLLEWAGTSDDIDDMDSTFSEDED